jgi:hypothetical protein
LPDRGWLENIERSKKYKTRQKSFPRERDCDESDELSGYLVDYDKLRVFGTGGS